MLNFTTDDLAPGDRFEHWREERNKNLFGVTIELPREQRANFSGRFSAVEIGGAMVSNMQASSYVIHRTGADIARMAGNSLCINRQVRGLGILDVGNDAPQAIGDGGMVFSHSDMPYTGIPRREGAFDYRMLRIPLRSEIALDADLDNLVATPSLHVRPLARPISALFNALTSPKLRLEDPTTAVTHLARLVLIGRGRLKLGLSETRAALRSGLFHAAVEIIARDLSHIALSPAGVAMELGVSLRQLHLLFEPSGRSFSRTLSDMRLSKARRLLQTRPDLSITEIAYRSGMESQATFYRAFRKAYGMTPGDIRTLAGSD